MHGRVGLLVPLRWARMLTGLLEDMCIQAVQQAVFDFNSDMHVGSPNRSAPFPNIWALFICQDTLNF